MINFPPTIIYRHKKENLKKCTLRGLERNADFKFYTYPQDDLPSLKQYILLSFDGPLLSKNDSENGLIIIDGTWRYASKMQSKLPTTSNLIIRSLPSNLETAYPRYQTECEFPERGLASIEALVVAYKLMERNYINLLDNYYWKEDFLKKNADFFMDKK